MPYHAPGHTCVIFFFFNDPATTEIYTLSLHDALPISPPPRQRHSRHQNRSWLAVGLPNSHGTALPPMRKRVVSPEVQCRDRKSTRLNSSHGYISYAGFCLKKKKRIAECIQTCTMTIYT